MQRPRPFFAVFFLLAAALACTNPAGGGTPPASGNVETIVAATFAALTAPATSEAEAGVTPLPPTSSLLPHSIYFLGNDGVGIQQVFRLEKDGTTMKQVTFEPVNVEAYDVSRVDGSVVYISNNQMLIIQADGTGRRLLFDGGPSDENNPYLTDVTNPVFSPNGQTIAYGHKGLSFYSIATGQSNRVIENVINDMGNGLLVPRELYWPEKYTADGSKLVITIGHYEGATSAIYYPNGGALVQLQNQPGALICCGDTEWTPDGSAFYAGNSTIGMFSAGLWRVDAANGNVTTLLAGDISVTPANLAEAPFLAPDGQLYFFFYSMPNPDEFVSRVPLQIVRSGPDGATNRTVLRPETYELMNEALWAPDASFVVVAIAPIADVYQGGQPQLVYTDGQKSVVKLPPAFAVKMKWGP